jgi:GNAT superfamily N-acetyltransferase
MRTATIGFRGIVRPNDPAMSRVRALYEQSINASERIPWEWLAGFARAYAPLPRKSHLIVAQRYSDGRDGPIYGFVTGLYLPRFGGYLSYVAVDPRARGRGIGAKLYKALIRRLWRSARAYGQSLPFLLWDSRPPSPSDGPRARLNWESRLALFKKIGGHWVEGIQFASPNYLNPLAGDVPLEFFLKPVEDRRSDFTEGRLRRIVRGLLKRVYRLDIDGEDGESLREYAPLRLAPIA